MTLVLQTLRNRKMLMCVLGGALALGAVGCDIEDEFTPCNEAGVCIDSADARVGVAPLPDGFQEIDAEIDAAIDAAMDADAPVVDAVVPVVDAEVDAEIDAEPDAEPDAAIDAEL